MKRKSLLFMLAIALLFVNLAAIRVDAANGTTVYVDPVEGTADPGAYYLVDVTVAAVDGLNSWEFKLKYTPVVLDLTEEGVIEGPFLSAVGATDFRVDVTPYGYVQVGCALKEAVAASGDGTLVTFKFLVLGGAPGYCNLTLFDTHLYDVNLDEIEHTAEAGQFTSTLVPDFTWTPTNPLANETVTFNATESYSPIGKNIVDYSWSFGDGDTGTGIIVEHTYSAYRKDPYMVNLTVTDEDGRKVSACKELRIYRDVSIADIWVTDQNADEAFTKINPLDKAEYYPPYGIVVTAVNVGTRTETFNVTLTFSAPTDLVTESTYEVTLEPGTGSGFSLWYDWNPTDPAGNPLPPGIYTFTATATTVEGEIDTTNNVMSFSITVAYLHISLTPDTGFACATVEGAGFSANSTVTIAWDGTPIPTVPSLLVVDSDGSFTAIISVPTQNEPGVYTVTATDENGNTAEATFTVVDMTGPQGPEGPKGDTGDTGPQGPEGPQGASAPTEVVWASIIIAIVAICIAIYSAAKKH